MQLDQADRGFSFIKDGPRYADEPIWPMCRGYCEHNRRSRTCNILYLYGRARQPSYRTCHRQRREATLLDTTLDLADLIENVLPAPNQGKAAATRSFQALRAVNDEYGELYRGLMAAERALKRGAVGGCHSFRQDRIKRFYRCGRDQMHVPTRCTRY